MAIWKWLTGLRRSRDAAALKRAEGQAVETAREHEATSGDLEAAQLDEQVVKLTGDTRSETEQLGD